MPLAGIDEASSFRKTLVNRLVQDILGPRLADLDGELWTMGTPGVTPAGYFHDITSGNEAGWSVFKWTFLDNPHLPLDLDGKPKRSPEEKRLARIKYLQDVRARHGWDEDHPTYQREWLGHWVRDETASVYRFDRDRNTVSKLPEDYEKRLDEWIHIIGIDYGYVDSTAWVVFAFRAYGNDPTVYCLESFKKTGLTPSQAADETKLLQDSYQADVLVGDSGGLGKGYIEEAQLRHQLPIEPAEKTEKRAYIEHMNGDFISGRIKFVAGKNPEYIDELQHLQWDEQYAKDDPRWHTKEDSRFENHLTDAGLYGWRRCCAYMNTEAEVQKKKRDPWVDEEWDQEPEEQPWFA